MQVQVGVDSARDRARRLYDGLIPSAHAHPGVDHFAGGEARGEWLTTVSVDALAASPVRVTGLDIPMPYAANLEKLALPSPAQIVDAAKRVTYK